MSGTQPRDSNVLAEIEDRKTIQCGKEVANHFSFDAGYLNLNHGAYGTYPIEIRDVFRFYQGRSEARPDTFIRYDYRTKLLNESRQVIADHLSVPVETCVYVPNASTGIDTVLRNLQFSPGDVIICFSSVYPAIENTLQYLTETTPVEVKKIEYSHLLPDWDLSKTCYSTIRFLLAKSKKPWLAIFDTISYLPAVRMPFERLTRICRSNNVLSLIDGAHGIGHLALNLPDLDPDFFVSNWHKWLNVPRGCGLSYVPTRNQHLLRATLPTGFGFVPQGIDVDNFILNFAYVGTKDDTPYLCVAAALEWRKKLIWEDHTGEAAIIAYNRTLAQRGGEAVATILGTEVLSGVTESLTDCNFTNVRLPLSVKIVEGDMARAEVSEWIMKIMTLEYDTAVGVYFYDNAWWARLSAQIYLTLEDFELAGKRLKMTCERVQQGEWKQND